MRDVKPERVTLADMTQHLSKSQFLRGLQCPKSLWLYRNRPELRTMPDEALLALYDEGTEVGLLARGLFPGGTAIEFEGSSFEEKISRTKALIAAGTETIYEATFSFDGVLAMVDILHSGSRGWELYEVKSSTTVKDYHISDVALQHYVLKKKGLKVSKASVVHINNEYVRHGALDIRNLFTIADITGHAQELQDRVEDDVACLQKILESGCPATDISARCHEPFECDYKAHCWAHIPCPSVFDIHKLRTKRMFDLYNQGIVKFEDIPPDYPLNDKQRMQVDAELTDKKFIDPAVIRSFLNELRYPLFFLDFETFQPAIPQFDGTRPFQTLPFQFSVHSLDKQNGRLQHSEFLAKPGADPREGLIIAMIAAIPSDVCVLAFNSVFEKRVIRELAGQFPKYKTRLMILHDNILDLMTPFKKRHYYTKEQKGSNSLKSILPALVPGAGYKGMAVSNGGEASLAYASLMTISDSGEAEKIRAALLEYCKLDTLAMVWVLEKLRQMI